MPNPGRSFDRSTVWRLFDNHHIRTMRRADFVGQPRTGQSGVHRSPCAFCAGRLDTDLQFSAPGFSVLCAKCTANRPKNPMRQTADTVTFIPVCRNTSSSFAWTHRKVGVHCCRLTPVCIRRQRFQVCMLLHRCKTADGRSIHIESRLISVWSGDAILLIRVVLS